MPSVLIKRITTKDPLYQSERTLRNQILLRPIGLPDHAWEMHDEKSWHFVAIAEEQVIGCVVLVPLSEDTRKAQLIQMAISSDFQGQGIGAKLVNELIDFSKSQEIREITCHARSDVVKFYSKLGFETFDEPFEEVGIIHRHMRMFL